ncbi:hypothetical protein NRB_22190 [Novosphingobium sp. 11B]
MEVHVGQSVPFTQVSDADIARALAEVPQHGWPADEEDLIRLFGRMLSVLAGQRKFSSAFVVPTDPR